MYFDQLKNDGVSMAELTQAINLSPYKSRKLAGLFSFKGVTQKRVDIERKHGVLQLVQTQPWGSGKTTMLENENRDTVPFECYHVPHDAQVHASEVNGIRAFGSEDVMETVEGVKNDKIARLRQNHENTFEHMRLGAVKGDVVDADGSALKPALNLFTKFGISQTTVDWDLDSAGTDILTKCEAVRSAIEDAVGDLSFGKIVMACSPEFFKALVTHAKVVTAYSFDSVSQFLRDNQIAKGVFDFGDIRFERYRTNALTANMINTTSHGEAYAYAEGIDGLFVQYGAPPMWNETVNTVGQPTYLRQVVVEDGHDDFIKLISESNPLFMCTRPESLIKCYQDND